MIDLTPLDVRKKRGDFAKALRGYDPEEVDTFLELVAERLEALVKENLQLSERAEGLSQQVTAQEGREKAVQEALVTAQALREDVKQQAQREADLSHREAQAAIDQAMAEAERMLEERKQSLGELERQRLRFLKSFRTLLERELDAVDVEESRAPLVDVAFEIALGGADDEEDEADDEGSSEIEDAAADDGDEEPAPEEADDDAEADEDVAESQPEVTLGDMSGGDDASTEDAGELDEEDSEDVEDVAEPDEEEASLFEGESEEEDSPAAEEVEASTDEEPAEEDDAGEDDDSLWLNSLLDGESRDEGRWS